jgi:anti-sigma factor RsiW
MRGPQAISDRELNAYVDAQLPAADRRDIERLIAADDAVRVQVESLLRVCRLVRMAYLFPGKE